MKKIILLTLVTSSAFAQDYILYRLSYDGKQKIAEFNGQRAANWYNCYYVKDLIEKDDYLAVESKKRTYECVETN